MTEIAREIIFLGSSRKDLRKLPDAVKDRFAMGLQEASLGKFPDGAKVLKGFGGRSVVELIDDYRSDTYRAVYTVRFKESLYVLHVFKKKSNSGISTPKMDRELIESRLKDAIHHNRTRGKK